MQKKAWRMLGLAAFIIGCAGLMSACGNGKDKAVTLDSAALAKELQESGVFEGELTLVDAESSSYMVATADGTEVELYMGDGSKADELLILSAEDASATDGNKEAAEAHLADVKASFEDYIPEEAAKAEDAVLVSKDKYVVMCICADTDTAKQIIDKYLDGEGAQASAGSDSKKKPDLSEAAEENDSAAEQKKEEPAYEKIESSESIKDFDSVVTVGNQAFELYNYSEEAAQNYADIVSKVGKELEGISTVYAMVPPTSVGVTFPDNLISQINSSDQKASLEKIEGFLDPSIKFVNVYPNLMSHRTEYIYFRTDHHWTALGAYYAYDAFCKMKGITPNPLENYKTVEFPGFVGSFYKDTNESSALGDNPDTILAYYPLGQNISVHVTAQDGQEYDWSVIYDVSNYSPGLKYSTFTAGDNPMTVIQNPDITDGSSCMVVKESFANAMIPFLTDHYQTIYVVDYRYWDGDVVSFAKENQIKDVLFVNNISMTRSNFLVGKLARVVK